MAVAFACSPHPGAEADYARPRAYLTPYPTTWTGLLSAQGNQVRCQGQVLMPSQSVTSKLNDRSIEQGAYLQVPTRREPG